MIKSIDILNDKEIVGFYHEVDKQNKVPFNHGHKHVRNVYHIMEKLCDAFHITDMEREALLIAAALHDVGQVNGRDNHGFKSMEFSKAYLLPYKDELGKYYDLILLAIEHHSSKDGMQEYPLFVHLLRFADKMDFTSDRLEGNYRDRFDYFISEDISDVNFSYGDTFDLIISLDNGKDPLELIYEPKFFHKVINTLRLLALKLGVEYRVYINGVDYTNECFNMITARLTNDKAESSKK